MKPKILSLTVLAILTGAVSVLAGHIPPSWEPMTPAIIERELEIARLGREASVMIFLSIVGILAGGVISAMQFLKKDGNLRVLVAVCGMLTASVTAINATVFSLSPKEVRERVRMAKKEMKKTYDYMLNSDLEPSGPERAEKKDKLTRLLQNVDEILAGATPASADKREARLSPSFEGVAHAGENSEGFSNFPKNPDYLYSVGVGRSASLDGAKEDSKRLAKQEIERAVLDQLPASPDSAKIAKIIAEGGGIADTDFKTERSDNGMLYIYSTLYAVKRRLVNDFLGASPQVLDQEVDSIQKSLTYYDQRWGATSSALDEARSVLSKANYDALLQARDARRDRNYTRCMDLLTRMVRPDSTVWYLGWFNLGLCAWNAYDFRLAKDAFENAIKLEPKLAVRDPSVYNSYGQFLVEAGDCRRADMYLKLALHLNPEITGARYALKNAEAECANGSR